MKVITEAILRDELRASQPESYTIPEGKILSPAAREYLQQCKIKIANEPGSRSPRKPVTESQMVPEQSDKEASASKAPALEEKRPEITATRVPEMPKVTLPQEGMKPKFVDYENGSYYFEKPEHMTHLVGNVLVTKDHKRIAFRGKLDSLQALFVLNECQLTQMGGQEKLIADLEDILGSLREMMRCDVLDEPFRREFIIGLSHKELREHSHNPMKFYQIKQMVLPSYELGMTYALLNQLRTAIRETEVAAAGAFRNGQKFERGDIIEELNRMSSAMHIIMCKYLAGLYE